MILVSVGKKGFQCEFAAEVIDFYNEIHDPIADRVFTGTPQEIAKQLSLEYRTAVTVEETWPEDGTPPTEKSGATVETVWLLGRRFEFVSDKNFRPGHVVIFRSEHELWAHENIPAAQVETVLHKTLRVVDVYPIDDFGYDCKMVVVTSNGHDEFIVPESYVEWVSNGQLFP
jgi:hypothetical protein